jgi:hypothetical protein
MRITKIKRLVSFGIMENISMECEVKENESVEMAAQYLESKIKKRIYEIEQLRKAENEAYEEKFKLENPDYKEIPF